MLAAKIYTALLNSSPQAPLSAALAAFCPAAPGRQQCDKLSEELAKDYDITST